MSWVGRMDDIDIYSRMVHVHQPTMKTREVLSVIYPTLGINGMIYLGEYLNFDQYTQWVYKAYSEGKYEADCSNSKYSDNF